MAREAILWTWLKEGKKLIGHSRYDLQRIENSVGTGMPDIEGCIDGGAFWVESKVLHGMNKACTRGTLKFEDGQRDWGKSRWRAGGASYILIGVPSKPGSDRIGRVFLIPGAFAMSLRQRGQADIDDLASRCILTYQGMRRKLAHVPMRDENTLQQLFAILSLPTMARQIVENMGKEKPELLNEFKSPADTVLAEMFTV